MTGRIVLFALITLVVFFAVTGGLARWLGRMGRVDEHTTVALAAGQCVLCGQWLPGEALEYITDTAPEQWCVDLTACKTYRQTGVMS